MRKSLQIVTCLILAASAMAVNPASATEYVLDMNKPMEITLPICKSADALNCLEPEIKVIHADGTTSIAKYLSSDLPEFVNDNGNQLQSGFHKFSVASGSESGEVKYFQVNAQFSSPYTHRNPYSMQWGKIDINIRSESQQLPGSCNSPYEKLCTQFNLDPDDKFQIVARTIKILSQDNQAEARNGDIVSADYKSGIRWIFSGYQTLIAGVDPVTLHEINNGGSGGTANEMLPELTWRLHIVGPGDKSAFEDTAKCAKYGATFRSENGTSAGQTQWDPKTQSLNFSIAAPHFDINGDPFRGFFKARLPIKWLACAYPGNTLVLANQVTVSIVYDDGVVQTAVSETAITKDYIYINVPDFHYSSPKIRISAKKIAPRVSSSKTQSLKYCSQGSTRKAAVEGKCPAGWRLVA